MDCLVLIMERENLAIDHVANTEEQVSCVRRRCVLLLLIKTRLRVYNNEQGLCFPVWVVRKK